MSWLRFNLLKPCLIFAFLSAPLCANTELEEQTITNDATLSKDGSPYYINGNITVANGVV